MQDGARERAGDRRVLRAAPGHAGHPEIPGAVVLRDHQVHRAIASEFGPAGLVRVHAPVTAELDRPVGGCRAQVRDPDRAGDPGVHPPAGDGGQAVSARQPAADTQDLPFVSWDGRLINSAQFDGRPCRAAIPEVTAWLAEKGLATRQLQYRLHDWCISRQRYWGPPIPIIYCDGCGTVPVPEKDLPVVLPFIEDFRPDDSGVSPLARHEEWYRVACPKCGKMGRRETDVSDTFLDSAWYFLRYPSVTRYDVPFDKKVTK